MIAADSPRRHEHVPEEEPEVILRFMMLMASAVSLAIAEKAADDGHHRRALEWRTAALLAFLASHLIEN